MAKPANLRTISAADLKSLQIDDRARQLYWNGEKVRSQISLSWWQTIVAIIGAVAGMATIVTGLNNASVLVCSRGAAFPLIGCPVQPIQAPTAATSPNPAPPPPRPQPGN